MTPLSEMSVDELGKVLTGSKWVLGILAVLIAMAGIFNQWVSDRIAKLQASAKVETQRRLEQSEAELRETKAKTAKLEIKLAPRALSETAWLAISERLLDYPGTQFQFVSYQDDAEVKGLVMPMIKSLLKAGWKGLPAQEFLMIDLFEGVAVEYAPESEKTLGPAARALAAALNAHNIAANSVQDQGLASHPDRLRIKVGKKPSEQL
jgi:hypothetical protein